jgi:hypothetical protein
MFDETDNIGIHCPCVLSLPAELWEKLDAAGAASRQQHLNSKMLGRCPPSHEFTRSPIVIKVGTAADLM